MTSRAPREESCGDVGVLPIWTHRTVCCCGGSGGAPFGSPGAVINRSRSRSRSRGRHAARSSSRSRSRKRSRSSSRTRSRSRRRRSPTPKINTVAEQKTVVAVEANRNTESDNFQNSGRPRSRTRHPVSQINVADWLEWQVWGGDNNQRSQEFQWHQVTAVPGAASRHRDFGDLRRCFRSRWCPLFGKETFA